MRPSIVKIAAWGDRHVASLQENIIPCLMSAGNLPALAASAPTELILYTDRPAALVVVDDIPGLTMTVHVMERPPDAGDLPANRRVLARTDADSVRTAAARGSDWFGFQADTLVSDEFLPRVKALLDTHLAVAGSPVRTSVEALRMAVGAQREFDARMLRLLSMACLHPVTAGYFVRDPPTTIPADPHQLLFRTADGFAARTWQPCPFGIGYQGLLSFLYDEVEGYTMCEESTIDCHLIQNLRPAGVRLHDPAADDFYLTSLDDGSGIPTFGEFPVTAAGIAASIRKFSRTHADMTRYARALDNRFAYPTDAALPGSLGEEESVAAVRRELGL